MRNLLVLLWVTFAMTSQAFAQDDPCIDTEPTLTQANFTFATPSTIDCENVPNVCFELQVAANPGSTFEFAGVNLRMLFDEDLLSYHSYIPTLQNYGDGGPQPFETFTYTNLAISEPATNFTGMVIDQYLQLNIDAATAISFFTPTVTEVPVTFMELCFTITGDVANLAALCEPLVYDLQEDGCDGLQPGNQGLVASELVGATITPLNEEVTQYNWEYTSNDGGVPVELDCIDMPCSDLGVEMVSFVATKSGERQAKLYWETSSETNNDFFLVQRSRDGRTFVDFDKVKGNGTTSKTQTYELYDNEPFDGVNYYRLIQYDYDGKSSLSGVRSLTFLASGREAMNLQVRPNPFVKDITLQYNASGASDIMIMDLAGNILETIEREDSISETIDMSRYAAGFYLIKVITGDSEQIVKVVKSE